MKHSSRTLLQPLLTPRNNNAVFIVRRSITGRPGQPGNLNKYDKGPSSIPIPLAVSHQEAEVMGRISIPPSSSSSTSTAAPPTPRKVPTNAKEFEAARLSYKEVIGDLRTQFQSQFEERTRREEAAADEYRANILAEKEARQAEKSAKRATSAAKDVEFQLAAAAERVDRKEKTSAVEYARLAKIAKLRKRWLDSLEKEATTRWIPEDQIESRITAGSFALKFAWQFEKWFEVKERKRQLREEARRTRRPGQPLREVLLNDSEAGFASDWESEGEEDVGVGSARHAALVADSIANNSSSSSSNSSSSGSAAQAEALVVARRTARERGTYFPEPAYDADGRPLPADDSSSGGIGLAELYHGKKAEEVLAEYEAYMAEYAKKLGLEDDESSSKSSSRSKTAESPSAATTGAVLSRIDDGERPVENAYIEMCVRAGNVEALFYSLLRKRDRLVRGITTTTSTTTTSSGGVVPNYETALLRFARDWGTWLSSVGNAAGGVFDVRNDPNATIFLNYMTRAGVHGGLAAAKEAEEAEEEAAVGTTHEDGHATGSPGFDHRNLTAVGSASSSVPLPKMR